MAWSFRQGHPRLVAIVSAVLVLAASFAFASAKLAGTAMAATPTMSTTASTNTEVGFQLFDNANLRNGDNPTGTIRFDLYGPDDATCATSIFNSIVTVTGNGSYNSASFITSQAGTYQWRAAYSGDANNTAITSACNEPSEQTIVTKALTVLSTTASGPIAIGGTITDTAHLSGGFNPTGTITFDLTGPNDVFCTGAVAFTSTVTVNGNGDYVSGPFAPTATGTYQWRARYSGDDNNLGEGPTGCIDPAESVIVVGGLVTPTLTTTASASVEAGGTVRDTAVLGGGALPTGTIGFQLYGPNDATCSGTPISTPPVPVNGNGTYVSPDITVNTPGTYRFVASYSGDIANNPVATACNDPAESVVVTPGTGSTTTSSSTSSTVPTTSSSTSSTVPTTSSSTSSTVPGSSTSSSSTVPGSSTSSQLHRAGQLHVEQLHRAGQLHVEQLHRAGQLHVEQLHRAGQLDLLQLHRALEHLVDELDVDELDVDHQLQRPDGHDHLQQLVVLHQLHQLHRADHADHGRPDGPARPANHRRHPPDGRGRSGCHGVRERVPAVHPGRHRAP